MQNWNTSSYDQTHGFVARLGEGVVELLNPQPDETILDLGCGTGHLSAHIAQQSSHVVGLDPSAEMLQAARANYPDGDFRAADARDFSFPERFDAVFTNAVLHWIPPAGARGC